MDGGVAKLGIRGVCKFSAGNQFIAQGTLGTEREMIFRGFSIDEKARASRMRGGGLGSGAVAFFADHEEQCKIADSGSKKLFGCSNHGSDNALGIAGTATPQIILILAGGEKWRNGVHVGGKCDDGIAPENVHIVAIGLDSNAFDLAAIARRKRG